jgi:hypothetical protein
MEVIHAGRFKNTRPEVKGLPEIFHQCVGGEQQSLQKMAHRRSALDSTDAARKQPYRHTMLKPVGSEWWRMCRWDALKLPVDARTSFPNWV